MTTRLERAGLPSLNLKPTTDYTLVVLALQNDGGDFRYLQRALAQGLVEKAGRKGRSLLWRAT